ncbi:MAG: DUF4115 domain-containing protein [Acinetobacter harbinensis]|nr:DUF4115 domain-containing protein [Acinetobacter harbinensis]
MTDPEKCGVILSLDLDLENVSKESPGAKLRGAREAAGVHIGALAASLKIPVSKLEALESDNFSALPDAVFARALASSVCRTLGMNSVSVLDLMPKNNDFSFSVPNSRINTPFKEESKKLGLKSFFTQFSRPVGIAVVILLLGALALGFLPFNDLLRLTAKSHVEVDFPVAELNDKSVSISSIDFSDSVTNSKSNHEEKVTPITANTLSTELIGTSPDILSVASNIPLELRARGDSWVQVRDATKAVVFERTLSKGEIASPKGNLPFVVVIGRADVTEVFMRGKAFDLTSIAKDNVARFEVRQ